MLLAIADFADDDGFAFPSIATLAAKSRLGESQTHCIVRNLRTAGELEIEQNAGPHRTNIYRVRFLEGVAHDRVSFSEGAVGDTPEDAIPAPEGAIPAPEGTADATQRVSPTAPKPSGNRQGEPSGSKGEVTTLPPDGSSERETPSRQEPDFGAYGPAFTELSEIPGWKWDAKKDQRHLEWLQADHDGVTVTPGQALRAATALAAKWDGRKYRDIRAAHKNWCLTEVAGGTQARASPRSTRAHIDADPNATWGANNGISRTDLPRHDRPVQDAEFPHAGRSQVNGRGTARDGRGGPGNLPSGSTFLY